MGPSVGVSRLTLTNYRNYRRLDVSFAPGLNVLSGPNGAGKTNILEAVAYLALGRSPRTPRDSELVGYGGEVFEIALDYGLRELGGASTPQPSLSVRYRAVQGRAVRIDDRPVAPSALYGRFLAVFFCPDDLWLLKGGPSARRSLLDRLLVQGYPVYADALMRYREALQQRNATLKEVRRRRAGRAMLAIWEPQLVQYGGEIARRRAETALSLQTLAAEAYRDLAGAHEPLECRYAPGLGTEEPLAEASRWEAALEAALEGHREQDIAMGLTSIGPHRDDLQVLIDGKGARAGASQGQQRSAVLALKFAERSHLFARTGRLPVFLVDDVLSELDPWRRGALEERLAGEGQVFLTTADDSEVPAVPASRHFAVRGGAVSARA